MYHIDLVETDYFGLQFMDTDQVSVSKRALLSVSEDNKLAQLTHLFSPCLLALAGYVQAHKETDPR